MSKQAGDEQRESQQGTGQVIRSICADIWLTAVNGVDDGEIEVRDVGGNKLEGTHLNSGDQMTGHCTGGPQPSIHLERTDSTGTLHTYDGRIFPVELPLPGTVPITVIIGTHSPSKALVGDDDWMGGHTT